MLLYIGEVSQPVRFEVVLHQRNLHRTFPRGRCTQSAGFQEASLTLLARVGFVWCVHRFHKFLRPVDAGNFSPQIVERQGTVLQEMACCRSVDRAYAAVNLESPVYSAYH